jgi:hypothetical protein
MGRERVEIQRKGKRVETAGSRLREQVRKSGREAAGRESGDRKKDLR